MRWVFLCLGGEHREHAGVAVQTLMGNFAACKKAHQRHITQSAAHHAQLSAVAAKVRATAPCTTHIHRTRHTSGWVGLLSAETHMQPHPARRMAGAVYVSCAGRGGPHFGSDSAELRMVRRALGDVPLVGFFAGGEIAHQSLHGYTGVLTVFTTDA